MNGNRFEVLSDGDFVNTATPLLFRGRKIWAVGGHRSDIVYLAWRRLLEEIRQGPDAELEDGFPWLWSAIRQASLVPRGLYRLIVEESRFQAWLRVDKAVELLEQAFAIVKLPELSIGGLKLHHDLFTRTHAYLGEAFRMNGQHIESEQAFRDAERHLELGTGDREVEATVYELRAALAEDQNDLALAGGLLDKAKSLLCGSPELEIRLAVVMIARGNVLSRQGDRTGAREHFLEAMQQLPPVAYPRLRLSVEHSLAFEHFRSGEYDAALARLAQAAPMYERYADALLQVQRLWIVGSIHLRHERWQEAEEALRQAVKRYLDLGYGHEVVRILFDLCTVYRCSNQPEMFQRFVILLNKLRQKPEVEALILDELRKVHQVISGSESAQELSRVIDALAARVEKPPN